MSARTSHSRLVAWLALTALGSACAIERAPLAGECVQGRAIACTCSDGAPGATMCAADGVFGACQCAETSAGGQGGGAAPPMSGAGAIGGAGGSAITDPVAGGAPPALDAGGTGGDTASDGMMPDDAGVDANDGGGVMSDGAMPEPQPPRPGQAYGPCRADGSCDAPLFCALATLGGTETYCTMFCSVSGFGGQPCPAQPSGNPGACVSNVCAR